MGLLGKENRPVHAGGPERILRAEAAKMFTVTLRDVIREQ